jgi:hypothetical protein
MELADVQRLAPSSGIVLMIAPGSVLLAKMIVPELATPVTQYLPAGTDPCWVCWA